MMIEYNIKENMSTTTTKNGGLCDQIIRNLCMSFLAQKFDLYVDYSNHETIVNDLGIKLHKGIHSFSQTKSICNNDFMRFLHDISYNDCNLNLNGDYFQEEEITNILYRHLNEETNRNEIMIHNEFKERYHNNNDLFIHIPLSNSAPYNSGLIYYMNAISSVQSQSGFNKIFLATDSLEHPIVVKICENFEDVEVLELTDVQVIQFGSTCKNVVLSFGSFSAVIGYFSFFSNVYWSDCYRPFKCGPRGLFSGKNWNLLSFHDTNILSGFPRAFFLTLNEKTPGTMMRQNNIDRQCKKYDIQYEFFFQNRWPKCGSRMTCGDVNLHERKNIDLNKFSILSTLTGHLMMIKRWLDNYQDEYAFFGEDDVNLELCEAWDFTWNDFLSTLPNCKWDFIQLVVIMEEPYFHNMPVMNVRKKEWNYFSCAGYLLRRSYAQKICNKFLLSDFHVDVSSFKFFENRFNFPEDFIYNYNYENKENVVGFSRCLFNENGYLYGSELQHDLLLFKRNHFFVGDYYCALKYKDINTLMKTYSRLNTDSKIWLVRKFSNMSCCNDRCIHLWIDYGLLRKMVDDIYNHIVNSKYCEDLCLIIVNLYRWFYSCSCNHADLQCDENMKNHMDYLFSISSYWCKNHNEGFDACKRLLKKNKYFKATLWNYRCYFDVLKDSINMEERANCIYFLLDICNSYKGNTVS